MQLLRVLATAIFVNTIFCNIAIADTPAGQVDHAVGKQGMYRLSTGGTSGKIVKLPRGLADLKQIAGGYAVFYNERNFDEAHIEKWAADFCAFLKKDAAVKFQPGSGPRRRVAAFSCN